MADTSRESARHGDWPWPLSLIPRRLNSWKSDKPPKMLLGNVPADKHLDVPPCGTWAITWPLTLVIRTKMLQVEPGDFATLDEWLRFKDSVSALFAIGLARYDYEAHYYTAPRLTFKFYGGFRVWFKAWRRHG